MTLAQLRYAITVANSNSMNEAAPRNLLYHSPVYPQQSVNWRRKSGRAFSQDQPWNFRHPRGRGILRLRPPGGRAIRTDRIQIRFQRTYQEEIQRLHAALYLRG